MRTQMSDVIGKAAIPFTARGMAAGFNANILFSDENLEDSTNTITFAAIKRKKLMENTAALPRPELLQVADAVARDKGIDRDEVLGAMEFAIQKAGHRPYH